MGALRRPLLNKSYSVDLTMDLDQRLHHDSPLLPPPATASRLSGWTSPAEVAHTSVPTSRTLSATKQQRSPPFNATHVVMQTSDLDAKDSHSGVETRSLKLKTLRRSESMGFDVSTSFFTQAEEHSDLAELDMSRRFTGNLAGQTAQNLTEGLAQQASCKTCTLCRESPPFPNSVSTSSSESVVQSITEVDRLHTAIDSDSVQSYAMAPPVLGADMYINNADKTNHLVKTESDSFVKSQFCYPPTVSAPSFRRQLSRRRSYQETCTTPTTPPPSATTTAADSTFTYDGKDSDKSEEKRVTEEGSDESLHSTPPGSPSAKSRRVDMGSFDPYQVFQVQHLPCLILTVRVLRGRNITNGWAQDLIDTPDPYVILRIKTAPEGRKRTRTIDNDCNPVWNETFTFFVNFSQSNILEITLMEANPLNLDQNMGTIYYNIEKIVEMGKWQTEVFIFNGISEVHAELHLQWDQNPTLRYSLCLSDKEKEFMRKRKEKVFQGLNRLLGEKGPQTLDEAPTIAVIGSGGGFRAMTGYSGAFKALAEAGLLDCTTYACGLSGSSWYLSTLYSHPRWPDLNLGEIQQELKHNVDKSLIRLLGPSSVFRYLDNILKKRRQGQPVSFTDFFGHMVGETLLKGRLDSRLTDQRGKIQDAMVPMPLYTCVHVKKDVPARSFQEWVEFSPYEIGLPKYGTFMDAELFGSKFFMGKLVRKYEEAPLHFLQGIWGSAFCILFKRLLEDNRRVDPVEMIRLEMGKELEKAQNDEDSDLSDDSDDDGSSTDDEDGNTVPEDQFDFDSNLPLAGNFAPDVACQTICESTDLEGERMMVDSEASVPLAKSDSKNRCDDTHPLKFYMERVNRSSQISTNAPPKESNRQPGSPKKGVRFSEGVEKREEKKARFQEKVQPARKPLIRRTSTLRRGKSRGYWTSVLKGIFENKNFELLSTRAGRAAVIHNFMRGLSLQQTYPLSPFTPVSERVHEGDEFDGIFDMHPTHIKHIYMVDAGLTFNSPYPLVLRPQRGVDIILSFDFSARHSDSTPPFKELLLAEKWAHLNRLPFPPIDPTIVDREGLKELYVFKHPTDPLCPIVLHFALINIDFRKYIAPGVPRETKEDFAFADFDIFDDPATPYSTFNFTYTHLQFERLSKLIEFNTLNNMDEVKRVIADVITRKRLGHTQRPIYPRDIKLLRMKSVQERQQMKKFMRRMESRAQNRTPTPTSTEPPTPFFTPAVNSFCDKDENPFLFSRQDSQPYFSKTLSESSSEDGENPFFKTFHRKSVSSVKDHGVTDPENGIMIPADEDQVDGLTGADTDKSKKALQKQPSDDSKVFSSTSSSSSSPSSACISRGNSDEVFNAFPGTCLASPFFDCSEFPYVHPLSLQHPSNIALSTEAPVLQRNQSRQLSLVSRSSSLELFYDAAEAMTSCGRPVSDPTEAKMHYEGAKARRKFFRRQSTISSLNSSTKSISLDSTSDDAPDTRYPKHVIAFSTQSHEIDVLDLTQFEGTADLAEEDSQMVEVFGSLYDEADTLTRHADGSR